MIGRYALALGYAGLLPAIVAVVAVAVAPPEWQGIAYSSGALYAGLILSFLGGTWWAMAARASPSAQPGLMTLAVLPSLSAAAILITLTPWRLVVLGGLIVAALAVDRLFERLALAPRGWVLMRTPLSAGLGVLTAALGFLAMR